jgi:molybdopterin synthase catalytic subunit
MRSALVRRPIDPAALLVEAHRSGNGASVLFVGTVRDVNDGRPVTGMEYTAYEAMAQRELDRIAREAVDRFITDDIVVEHRLGSLDVGDVSVAVVAAHPHRARAFDAARYIVEELKRRVPVWKLEYYVDGTRQWVDPSEQATTVASAVEGP